MCGILGANNFNFNENLAYKYLQHRGPDGKGVLYIDNWKFLHARLTIVGNNEIGKQPITFKDNSGKLHVLIYNGEIYNYKQLSQEVLDYNLPKNFSDTDILIRLLAKYGMKILNKLNGCFAFAYYNQYNKKLYLVRDRYGIKPCFYSFNKNFYCFSSEIMSLIKVFHLPICFNQDIIQKHMRSIDSLVNIEALRETVYSNIYQVLAGEYLIIDEDNTIQNIKWYNYEDFSELTYLKNDLKNYTDYCELFEEILLDSLKLRSDVTVPFGITLSGGIDSSLLYVLLKEKLKLNCPTFTYGQITTEYNESQKAAQLCKEYQDTVNVISPSKENWDSFVKYASHLSSPHWLLTETGAGNLFAKIKQNNIKVILEGNGPDEYLGGYEFTLLTAARDEIAYGRYQSAYDIIKISSKTLTKGTKHRDTDSEIFYKLISQNTIDRRNCFQNLNDKLFREFTFPENVKFTDRLTMASSLESRSPYLDHRLIEFSRIIPTYYKVNKLGNKAILRKILLKYGKYNIVKNKVKQGFLADDKHFINKYKSNFLELLYSVKGSNDIHIYLENKNTINYLINSLKENNTTLQDNIYIYKIAFFELMKQIYS